MNPLNKWLSQFPFVFSFSFSSPYTTQHPCSFIFLIALFYFLSDFFPVPSPWLLWTTSFLTLQSCCSDFYISYFCHFHCRCFLFCLICWPSAISQHLMSLLVYHLPLCNNLLLNATLNIQLFMWISPLTVTTHTAPHKHLHTRWRTLSKQSSAWGHKETTASHTLCFNPQSSAPLQSNITEQTKQNHLFILI